MRKLIYFVATTIDGRIAGPGGQTDFFPMAGAHIAAQVQQLPETLPRHVREALDVPERQARFDTVVMGRGTYQPALSAGITHPYAPLETIVFSRTLPERSEGNLRITAADPRRVVQELKGRAGRDIWLCGGADLASQLACRGEDQDLGFAPVRFYPLEQRNQKGAGLATSGLRLDHQVFTTQHQRDGTTLNGCKRRPAARFHGSSTTVGEFVERD